MKFTLLLLLLPALAAAQVRSSVEPIVSEDYMEQVRKLRGSIDPVDSVSNNRNIYLKLKGQFHPDFSIRRVKVSDNSIQISPQYTRYLSLSTSYNGSVEVKTHNRLPELQTDFVQGRGVNGAPAWRGPETGEMFSYGPNIHSLEFDGNNYPYDQNGRLVPLGTGIGKTATAYDNSIFRTAVAHSHQLKLSGELFRYGKRTWNFGLKLGQRNEHTIIRENNSISQILGVDLGTSIKWLSIKGSYLYNHDQLSNGNRTGFLNRAYQNALLTPTSFSNIQGTMIGDAQRSYSNTADNPWFLLKDNNNRYRFTEQNASLVLAFKRSDFDIKLTQSLQYVLENTVESYKPGTVSWVNGMYTDRNKRDLDYLLQLQGLYNIQYYDYHFNSQLGAYYTYGNANTRVRYRPDESRYNYQRSSHDAFLTLNNTYHEGNIELKVNAGNKFYLSNTASKNDFILPAFDAALKIGGLLPSLELNISSSYHEVSSELAIDKSLAYTNLLQYSTEQAFSYRPVIEAAGYKGLTPVNQREWNGALSLSYAYTLQFNANVYIKNTRNDVFPVYSNGTLLLKNIADLRNKGIELSLQASNNNRGRAVNLSGTLSFFKYNTTVTRVNEGDNFTPIAGFSNVHKALVQGHPLGVIVGNTYLKDASGKTVIGDDGFPLVNPTPQIIGNSIPDFVVKFNNIIMWKKLTLQANWEWKKGGETWNGTQAALDYYGRSALTGAQRNTANYVFNGVRQDGHVNDKPVSFYDPAQPVEKNRWTRYGLSGVAAAYVQKTDYLRLNNVNLSHRFNLNRNKEVLTLSTYVNNILLWSAYKGADPDQLLFDQPNTTGLDFFNLPAAKTYGFNVSFQF
ncbi:TonB-dependent receptor [Chitinophaga filiformis]|uniref:TonB-linked outer membrane protein, SusC/RagA family n=1 Tax=Chitinophaga filiformis TaxID=104663 RepID=A0A1G7S4X0_CHIFI|nr:hypothetical protein [Chitinophaga filiformis]SDG17230.1 hypothetical protein SAMN04488121_103712 [Chitinophaga filiformis]